MKTVLPILFLTVVSLLSAQNQILPERTKRDFLAEQMILKKSNFAHRMAVSNNNSPGLFRNPNIVNWQLLCGSMNTYGMISSNQQPLQYHPGLKAVSFVHRKSDTYMETPTLPAIAKSGVVVAEISGNWGATWDSTCFWSDATEFGRYPQGGIYSPATNTLLSNAYIVGTGVTVDASDFSGSWYASKPLSTFNSSASTIAGAQQFYSFNLSSYPANMPRHGWSHQGFTITDDGVAHSLGVLGTDLANTETMRGYAVVTGTFNGSTFDWKLDSIIPNAAIKADGTKHLSEGQMVWNPSGTVGYVVGIGVRNNATLSNRSYQPIIYKLDRSLNANATWTLVNQLDFNTTYSNVASHLPGIPVTYPVTTGSTAPLPFTSEFDLAIDKDNNLHLGIVFMSGYSDHPDSLHYYTTFNSIFNPTESYRWQHVNGDRPYIYDFMGNGISPWKLMLVDSISSESPGFQTGTSGYQDNPWDADANGDKLTIDARLQLSRSAGGELVLFSWAESDTLFTNSAFKYNNLPELKVRAYLIESAWTHTYCTLRKLFSEEINVTGNDFNVRTRGTLHYLSPISGDAIRVSDNYKDIFSIKMPLTVTNSNPYSQATNNATWFGKADLTFDFNTIPIFDCTGISENDGELNFLRCYPNPAEDRLTVNFNSRQSNVVEIKIIDARGQVVKDVDFNSQFGENEVQIDVHDEPKGMYFIQVKSMESVSVQKIVIH